MGFRLYNLWYGKKQEEQLENELPEDIRMTCTQFTKYHKDQCFHDIVKRRRWEHIVRLTATLVRRWWENILNKQIPLYVCRVIHKPQYFKNASPSVVLVHVGSGYFSFFLVSTCKEKYLGWMLLLTFRCGKRTMVDCFLGCELVEWLQQVGLAQDRGEAVLYGMRLQQGGVLQHIKEEYGFQDSRLYYRFTE